jgi:hypothetical protein
MWNSRTKVAAWIEERTGSRRGVRAQKRSWEEYLRKLGHTPPQVPPPSSAGADPEEQEEAFKKSCPSG